MAWSSHPVFSVLSAGAEGEAPCRAEAGVESEEKSSERVDLPTGPTRDGLRASRRTDSKQNLINTVNVTFFSGSLTGDSFL